MRYDIDSAGHSFRQGNEPKSFSDLNEKYISNKKYANIVFFAVAFALWLFDLFIVKESKRVDTKSPISSIMLLIAFLFVIGFVSILLIPDNISKLEARKRRIIGIIIMAVTTIAAIPVSLINYGIIDFTLTNSMVLAFYGVVSSIIAICLIALFIYRKQHYTVKTTAECIGYDDKIITIRSQKCVASAPVYDLHYEGEQYYVYEGKYVKTNDKMHHVGDTVELTICKNDPCDCRFGDQPKKDIFLIIMAFLLLFISLVIVAPVFLGEYQNGGLSTEQVKTELTEKDYIKKINRMALSDDFLEEVLEADGEDHEFSIYIRVLKSADENELVFEEYDGLKNSTYNPYNSYDAGEEYYWIERDDGLSIALKKSAYAYNGNRLVE